MVGDLMPTAIGGRHVKGHRLWPFLLFSVALHTLFAVTLRQRSNSAAASDLSPLTVNLTPPHPFTPALPASPATQQPSPSQAHSAPIITESSTALRNVHPRITADSAQDAHRTAPDTPVDLNAIRTQARQLGRAAASPPDTGATGRHAHDDPVAAAIARAYRHNNALIERQENGGWVIRDGKRRCVIAPRDIPYFMQGMLIAPVCDA